MDNQFLRDANNRLTFEMFRIGAADYPAVCEALAKALNLTFDSSTFLAGMDLLLMHYRRGNLEIELAWDNWMGFTVTAKNSDAEPLVREAGAWLSLSTWASQA